MPKYLYKYMGPKILELSLMREGFIGLKCSYPKDYNDPYELSLSIDTTIDTQLLAFYKDSLGDLPQYPTTCFSKSPVVTPMWAHYAHSSKGYVVEIDEEKLKEYSDEISIEDVTYSDNVNKEIESHLGRAFTTCKPRHTFFLHKAVIASAYFTKQTSWCYEKERRLIAPPKDVENIDSNMIYFIPTSCITSVIVGAKAETKSLEYARKLASSIECNYYQSAIGRSYPEKYLINDSDSVFIFNSNSIKKAISICEKCSEPLLGEGDKEKICSWCAITKAHQISAADNNVYRMLDHTGTLNEHVKSMEDIWKGKS